MGISIKYWKRTFSQSIQTSSGGSSIWGSITGDLTSQTDLQGALNLKQDALISGTNIKTVNGVTILGSGNIVIAASDLIIVVANYSALPLASSVSTKFYWVSNSQGTQWLPGSLGGTYYNKGIYYSNGTTWEYIYTPYQAIQSTVDAGTVTDQFVSPATLANSSLIAGKQSTLVSGTNIKTVNGSTLLGSGDLVVSIMSEITATATFTFLSEDDSIVNTILNISLTNAKFKGFSYIPVDTTSTSLDDFKLNGVSFNIENIIDNTSFNIRANASNNATGIYTITYKIIYQ